MLKEDNNNHNKVSVIDVQSSDEKHNPAFDFLSCIVLSKNDMEKTKLLLVKKINEIIAMSHLNQKDAAILLEVDQPKISQMKNNKISGFSIERLFKFFTKLGWGIKLTLEKR